MNTSLPWDLARRQEKKSRRQGWDWQSTSFQPSLSPPFLLLKQNLIYLFTCCPGGGLLASRIGELCSCSKKLPKSIAITKEQETENWIKRHLPLQEESLWSPLNWNNHSAKGEWKRASVRTEHKTPWAFASLIKAFANSVTGLCSRSGPRVNYTWCSIQVMLSGRVCDGRAVKAVCRPIGLQTWSPLILWGALALSLLLGLVGNMSLR